MSRKFIGALLLALSCAAGFNGGCSSEEKAPTPSEKALADPMNYNPVGKERYDVSGGGILDMDRKALRKDMSDVLSP